MRHVTFRNAMVTKERNSPTEADELFHDAEMLLYSMIGLPDVKYYSVFAKAYALFVARGESALAETCSRALRQPYDQEAMSILVERVMLLNPDLLKARIACNAIPDCLTTAPA